MRGIQQQRQQRCHQQSASGAAAAHRLTPHRCAAGPVACSSRARAALASPAAAAATATTTTAVETFVSREARAALFGSAEEFPETEASVKGSIPAWLNGSLLINGGADYKGMKHMFDGYAMLCKLRFSQGRVWGAQKYAQSDAYKNFSSSGKMRYTEFGTHATEEAPKWKRLLDAALLMATGKSILTDNPSVNVVPLPDGRLLALSESLPSIYHMDPESLQTVKQHVYADGVKGDVTTAHPKVMEDGTLVNFTRSFPFGGYHVYKQDPVTLRRKEVAFIKDRLPFSPAWVHDMSMSQDHLIIVENPLFMSIQKLMVGTVETCLEWKPEMGSLVHVVPLREGGGAVRSFQAPTFFTFHSANAFEQDGQLHVDLSVYDDVEVVQDLMLDRIMAYPGANIAKSGIRRLSIPLSGDTSAPLAMPRPLARDEGDAGSSAEFPCINPDYRGQSYRYLWANASRRPTNIANTLMKLDTRTGEVLMWHEDGALPAGATFVASPNSKAEDDGVIVTAVMGRDGKSFALVLDAASMKELGRAQLPFAMPYRFHGAFVPARA